MTLKPYKVAQHYLRASLYLLLALLIACSDNTDPRPSVNALELVDLLPASTRGLVRISGVADAAGMEMLLPSGAYPEPWRHNAADILRLYSGGMDLVGAAESTILAQPTVAGDEFLLLIALRDGGDPLNGVGLEPATKHKGFDIYTMPADGIFLTRLNLLTLAIAPRRTLESVIDVHLGTTPNIHESVISNYLDDLYDGMPFSFVYGLPALYRQVDAPGSGDSSLSQATVITGTFEPGNAGLTGGLTVFTANAVGYIERLLGLLPETSEDVVTAIEGRVNIDLAGLASVDEIRPLLKSLFHGMDAVDYAEAVIHGGNPPWINFVVGETPSSIFINFEFRDKGQRDAFTADHLPAGFSLAPQQIIENEEPRYFLVLNIYQSSGGLVEGARAEWSVFVRDPVTSQLRFLVVQAAAASFAADSVNLFTPPEPVRHLLAAGAINSYVGVVDDNAGAEKTYFSSSINWPPVPETLVTFDRDFVVANDYIFWGNAVADRGLYNSSVHNRDGVLIAASEITLLDNSRWAQYLTPEPVHTVAYLNSLQIVISPWWNLDADYLDVTEDYRQTLINFKNDFYPNTVVAMAERAMRGGMPSPQAVVVGESVASVYYHFVITDPQALFMNLDTGAALTPVALSLHDGEAPDYYLTLAVYEREGDPCGLRADWVTYASNESGRPYTLQLDAFSSDACLDPVSLLGLSAAVEQKVTAAQLDTRIASPFVAFTAQLDLNRAMPVLPSRDRVAAQDQVCSLNGVCSHFFYDGQTLLQPVKRISFGGIFIDQLVTPWDSFIRRDPAHVTVGPNSAINAIHPWRNVPSFGY